VPPFDLLSEQDAPYSGFGDPLPESPERLQVLLAATEDARRRITKTFAHELDIPSSVPQQLDTIIAQMWAHGWSPAKGNINLFATDFGLLLTSVLLTNYHGSPIFRSEDNLSHFSIWWPSCKLEIFPFHHMVKCLSHREANSVASFAKGLAAMVRATP
jgi:hypothetical protein